MQTNKTPQVLRQLIDRARYLGISCSYSEFINENDLAITYTLLVNGRSKQYLFERLDVAEAFLDGYEAGQNP